MTLQSSTILVAGATGQQGGAVLRRLHDDGFAVRALTRDPSSERSRALAAQGVAVVSGDLTDRASLERALEGVDGVFSMATPYQHGIASEVLQGVTLAEAAQAAGVRHYVYSSVGGADRHSGVPHFESKRQIENRVLALGLPATIVRPVYFFENFARSPLAPRGDGYVVSMPLSRERTLQGVAVADIAAFVALAFAAPDDWIGREIELAGDELTLPQYAAAMSRYAGAPVEYAQASLDTVQNDDTRRMFEFFEAGGYQADIAALRGIYPGLHAFEMWLAEGGMRHLRRAA